MRCFIKECVKLLVALLQLAFYFLTISNVCLYSPDSYQATVFNNSNVVVQQVANGSMAIRLLRFLVAEAVVMSNKRFHQPVGLLFIKIVFDVTKIFHPPAYELGWTIVTIHARHKIIAFGNLACF